MRQRVAVLADGAAIGRHGRRRRGPHPGAGAGHRPIAGRHGGDRPRLAAPGRLRDGSGSCRRARPGVPGPRARPRRVLPAPRLADRPRAAAGGRPGAACSRWRPLVAARSAPSSPDLGVVSAGHCLRRLRARVRLRRRHVADWRASPPHRSARRIGHNGGLVLPRWLQPCRLRLRGCFLVRFCRATAPGAEERNGPATRRGRFRVPCVRERSPCRRCGRWRSGVEPRTRSSWTGPAGPSWRRRCTSRWRCRSRSDGCGRRST